MGGSRAETVWITWERQRRTLELADALGAELHVLLSPQPWALRAVLLAARTVGLLARRQPGLLIVQNPSIVLTALACALRRVFGYRLVVDRHSNFKFHTAGSRDLKWRAFHALSRWTCAAADLTVVTNDHLRGVVEGWGGRGCVLQDRLPRLDRARPRDLGPGRHVVCVSSFSRDEPTDAVVAAAGLLQGHATLHVTGNTARCPAELRRAAPANLRFTGFLPEDDYQSLLASADVVLVLTSQDHTLVCGAYEAVALGRPLVLSDTSALRAYFGRGALFTSNRAGDIAATLRSALTASEEREAAVVALRSELASDWGNRFAALGARMAALGSPAAAAGGGRV